MRKDAKQHLLDPPPSSTDGRLKRSRTLELRHVNAVRGFLSSPSELPCVGPSSDRSMPIIVPSHFIQNLSEISSDKPHVTSSHFKTVPETHLHTNTQHEFLLLLTQSLKVAIIYPALWPSVLVPFTNESKFHHFSPHQVTLM